MGKKVSDKIVNLQFVSEEDLRDHSIRKERKNILEKKAKSK